MTHPLLVNDSQAASQEYFAFDEAILRLVRVDNARHSHVINIHRKSAMYFDHHCANFTDRITSESPSLNHVVRVHPLGLRRMFTYRRKCKRAANRIH